MGWYSTYDEDTTPGYQRFRRPATLLKVVFCAFLGGPLLAFVSVPLVRMFYDVPYFIETDLSRFHPAASRTIGAIFFIGLLLGPLLLRRWRWRTLLFLMLLSLPAFLALTVLYRVI